MANQRNKQPKDMDVTKKIKDAAGAAFHSAHRALESAEDAAMNAVDATADAISNVLDNDQEKE